jgi:biopolymer transport protein ExbD
MRLFKGRKKAPPAIPVVSMSDIAFLLIIFFLVTTNFLKESHIRLKLPKAEATSKEEKVQNSVSVDKDGVVWLNGEKSENLKQDLGNVLGDRQGDKRKVFLKCDKDLVYSDYMPVIQHINEAGGILVLKTDDKGKTEKGKGKEEDRPKEEQRTARPPKTGPEPKAEPEPGPEVESGL